MGGFERGSPERRIVAKLDSVSLMFRLGKAAQGMTLTTRRRMLNGRTLNIVRIVVRLDRTAYKVRVLVYVAVREISTGSKERV
jgi:hypothetical protein